MIVPMKKMHLIVQNKDTASTLASLRDLGVIHVEHQRALSGDHLTRLREDANALTRAVNILSPYKNDITQEEYTHWHEIVDAVILLANDIEAIDEDMAKRSVHIKQWESWGQFDPQDIEEMAKKGVFLYLYDIPVKEKVEVLEGVILKTVKTVGKVRHCAAVMREEKELPFTRITPPLVGWEEMKARQKKEMDKREEFEQKLKEYYKYFQLLQGSLKQKEYDLRFEEVARGTREEENLTVLKGFCPIDACEDLSLKAKEEQWAVHLDDPTDEDHVPTLLRNPKWVELSKPVFGLVEILPGYKEFDVSMILLIFFTIFFGMLVGDAAYGLIYAGLAVFAHVKMRNKVSDKTPFILLYLLTGFTVLWGVLTGTYFGQQWLPATVKPLVPWLNDYSNIQLLCFTIAIIHLSIARIWSAIVKIPSIVAISDIGWLAILWGMYFMANYFVLGMALPPFTKFLLLVGVILALIFMAPPKEILKTMPREIIPFGLNIVGAFTDIVSYIRLFAVGLATVAVADATNSMAAGAGPVGAVIILFIGHALNLILAAMAILVHGIRLNVLEFSGHLNLEWKGFKYDPFCKLQKT